MGSHWDGSNAWDIPITSTTHVGMKRFSASPSVREETREIGQALGKHNHGRLSLTLKSQLSCWGRFSPKLEGNTIKFRMINILRKSLCWQSWSRLLIYLTARLCLQINKSPERHKLNNALWIKQDPEFMDDWGSSCMELLTDSCFSSLYCSLTGCYEHGYTAVLMLRRLSLQSHLRRVIKTSHCSQRH